MTTDSPSPSSQAASSPSDLPWMAEGLTDRQRAVMLVEAMTLEQKIAQLHGSMPTIDIYALMNDFDADSEDADKQMEQLAAQVQIERHVKGIEELGIPRFRITNGPVGVGMGDGYPSPAATALPMTIGLAAGFDAELADDYGDIIGSETATLGQHVLEGPGVCLHRTAIAGRNFEYFSEDPYLSGVMGVAVARAIQRHDVIAMGKHYVVNDQECERFRTNVEVDEHVLRELYLLPFEMLVKEADIAAMMSAYNRVRGVYATENYDMLTRILRHEWGFDGYVQSDFWSCRSAAPSLNAGMDHEMPDAKWLNETNVKNALNDTSLEIETVDRALVRRYTQMFRFNQMGKPYEPGTIDAKAHGKRARAIGSQVAVLLKNEGGVLPLEATSCRRIVLVGQPAFVDEACNGGGGSSKVTPLYTVEPLEGLRAAVEELGGTAVVEKFTVKEDLSNLDEAAALVENLDEHAAVIIMSGLVATEGADLVRPHQPHRQDSMVERLLDAAGKAGAPAVCVVKDSTAVVLPWRDKAAAILEVWNQGSEDGNVVADLVFGRTVPGGKVPTSYPASDDDTMWAGHPERHPGVDEGAGYPVIRYSEGLEMGYRWHQANGVPAAFPFGFGLSYTTFDIHDVSLSGDPAAGEALVIEAAVTNTGTRAGSEVVQAYIGIPSPGQPPKRLVGFAKTAVEPGETSTVRIEIDPQAVNHPLSVWDYATSSFVIPSGEFTVYVGSSSEDNSFSATINL